MRRDILYVDDEFDNIIVFEAAFEDEFNIHAATSGAEALELLEKIPFPVVIADQRMPQMTGVELFETMRATHPHIKRIILTGYSEPEAMIDAINKGQVFHFVKKPWERHHLLSVLIRAFEAHDLAVANMLLTERLVVSERCAMLGQATARITHEMGNCLCMLPMLDVIRERYSEHEELVTIADFAAQTYSRLTALVQEVKSFMQFEQEQFVRHPLALGEAVHELVAFLRFDKAIPHERFTLKVAGETTVLANKVKLQQVIVNLIKNAAYAIRERPDGRIEVTVERHDADVVLSVLDNGCGIPEEMLPRIWEPFFTTKGAEGNGLGLEICRKLIESHGGSISCESLPGLGTTFIIRLPAHTEQVSAPSADLHTPAVHRSPFAVDR